MVVMERGGSELDKRRGAESYVVLILVVLERGGSS